MAAAATWRILQPDGTVSHIRGEAAAAFAVDVEVANGDDLALMRRGYPTPGEVRTARLRGLVDTSVSRLILPAWVDEALAFPAQETPPLPASGRKVVSQVRLNLLGRGSTFSAIVDANRQDAVIGGLVLECLDLLVDPVKGCLVPRDPEMIVTELG